MPEDTIPEGSRVAKKTPSKPKPKPVKLCRHCGRVDSGAPRCRDHPRPKSGERAFAQLSDSQSE